MLFHRSAVAGALLALACAVQAAQVSVHDPVMAKEGGTYYLFSTGPGITFYSSTNLTDWRPEGRVFAGEPAWARRVAPGFNDHVWAPDIQFHNGLYYLYYSVSGFGKNASGIGVAVNRTLDPRSPSYQWEDRGMVLQSVPVRDDWNAIDPNIVEDGKGGAWMAFGSFWSGLKLVKLNDAWTGLAEPQQWKAIAARPRAPGEPATTAATEAGSGEIEAPFIFRKNDYYYLFASFGLCCQKERSTYRVVVGRARDVTGPYLDRDGRDMMQGGGSPLIAGDKDWQGVGHNSAYTMDGKDYLVLHAYESADRYLQKLKILDITWDKDLWPVVDPRDLNRYRSTQLPAK